MAPIPNQYGSINGQDDKGESIELLPHGTDSAPYYNRLNSTGSSSSNDQDGSRRHRLVSLLLSAGICLVAAAYWHGRASSPSSTVHHEVTTDNGGSDSRVPMPPALSKLDPRELSFRSVEREGLASPSEAWGDYLEEEKGSKKKFVPLPTNEWYLVRCLCIIMLSHYRYPVSIAVLHTSLSPFCTTTFILHYPEPPVTQCSHRPIQGIRSSTRLHSPLHPGCITSLHSPIQIPHGGNRTLPPLHEDRIDQYANGI